MSLLSHAMEACGLLLAASSVRMVAGSAAGIAAASVMATIRWAGGESAPLLLPAAVFITVLLRTSADQRWRARMAVPVLAISACVFLIFGAKVNWRTDRVALLIAPIPALWLAMAIREKDGAAVSITALPLALTTAADGTSRLLLAAATVALAGLTFSSYRLKRYDEGG